VTESEIRAERKSLVILPTYRLVDTCAAEFEAYTPYYYSTYGDENERRESGKPKIMILGGGPNRIGQGIEFDYCCVHAAFALREAPNGSANSTEQATAIAKKVGYPVLVRPSFVLGGRAMELVYNEEDLRRYMASAIEVTPDRPVLIDRFLEDAIEVDVDCISDGETTVIGAIMEHIEEAGIHSGDSACVIPTFSLSQDVLDEISTATKSMARELNVRGLMNVQFAVKGDNVY